MVNDAIDPDLEAPCTGLCEAEQMITCDMSQAVANCTTDCQLLGTALPVCKTQLIGYLDCGAAADMFTCDADGDPQPAGCAGPALGFLACALTEYNVMP